MLEPWQDVVWRELCARDRRVIDKLYIDKGERLALECAGWRRGLPSSEVGNQWGAMRGRVEMLEAAEGAHQRRYDALLLAHRATLVANRELELALEARTAELGRQRRQLEELRQLVMDKDVQLQTSQDELALTLLEQSQLEKKIDHLEVDNRTLLSRWIEVRLGEPATAAPDESPAPAALAAPAAD